MNDKREWIRTSDGIDGFPATYRPITAADKLAQVMNEVEKDRKKHNRTEDIDWELLKGINNTLYE